jgi:hypothetical protein
MSSAAKLECFSPLNTLIDLSRYQQAFSLVGMRLPEKYKEFSLRAKAFRHRRHTGLIGTGRAKCVFVRILYRTYYKIRKH